MARKKLSLAHRFRRRFYPESWWRSYCIKRFEREEAERRANTPPPRPRRDGHGFLPYGLRDVYRKPEPRSWVTRICPNCNEMASLYLSGDRVYYRCATCGVRIPTVLIPQPNFGRPVKR